MANDECQIPMDKTVSSFHYSVIPFSTTICIFPKLFLHSPTHTGDLGALADGLLTDLLLPAINKEHNLLPLYMSLTPPGVETRGESETASPQYVVNRNILVPHFK